MARNRAFEVHRRHDRALAFAGGTITLGISCSGGELRVEVHGASRTRPSQADARVGTEIGPGLILVATLSHEWGSYRTPDGKAVYFALAFQPEI